MGQKVTTFDMVLGITQRAVTYNIIEFALVVIFSVMALLGGIWEPLLWLTLVVGALWVIITSSSDSQDEAKTCVLARDIYISDFLTGALFMTALALLSWDYGWQFPAMFTVAAGQNLRYTALSMNWLMEEKRERDKRASEEDHLS